MDLDCNQLGDMQLELPLPRVCWHGHRLTKRDYLDFPRHNGATFCFASCIAEYCQKRTGNGLAEEVCTQRVREEAGDRF